MSGEWIPIKSIDQVPKDDWVDLWVWRSDHTIMDCYFPKCYWAEAGLDELGNAVFDPGWTTEDGETSIGHADYYRIVGGPAEDQ
ncbi:hypothetical protein [Limimaricola cinnabarinus]|uniref:hypothetical protein n=1 Tax=Limimaricola cinnabarinus TaxID=1125964 RepID=UPI0024937300|nr:hypothetical protein [Limimaricola cinnabarinus]